MKRVALCLLLVSIAIVGYFTIFRRPSVPTSVDVTLYFTCDTRGRLVPCGCFSGQHGGLTRLKTVMESETPPASIRVDIGDAIKGAEDYNLIEYKYILQACAGMGFDAMNLGQREAQLSAQSLRALKTNAPVSLISANLLDSSSGKPIFDGYKIVRRGPYQIALIGVLDATGMGDNLGQGLMIEKMEATLSRLLPEVKKKADILILMAFTDETTLAKLAQDFYEFDLVLGGKVSQPSQKLEKQNRSLILYTTNQSRTLGILKMTIAGRAQLVPLAHEMRLLLDRIPEHPAIKALAEAYRAEIRHTRLALDDPAHLAENQVPGVKRSATYAGSASCEPCHQTATQIWKKSSHAQAFSVLVSKKADADPNCVACHTIGFGSLSGYQRAFAGAKLIDVGCESCHGPGSLHVEQHQAQAPSAFQFRPLGQGDCQKCHYGEFSRPFNWDTFWPPIQHGKEPKR